MTKKIMLLLAAIANLPIDSIDNLAPENTMYSSLHLSINSAQNSNSVIEKTKEQSLLPSIVQPVLLPSGLVLTTYGLYNFIGTTEGNANPIFALGCFTPGSLEVKLRLHNIPLLFSTLVGIGLIYLWFNTDNNETMTNDIKTTPINPKE